MYIHHIYPIIIKSNLAVVYTQTGRAEAFYDYISVRRMSTGEISLTQHSDMPYSSHKALIIIINKLG